MAVAPVPAVDGPERVASTEDHAERECGSGGEGVGHQRPPARRGALTVSRDPLGMLAMTSPFPAWGASVISQPPADRALRCSSPCRSPAGRAVAIPAVDAVPFRVPVRVPGCTPLGGVPGSADRWALRRGERRLHLVAEMHDWIGHCLRLLAWIGSCSGVSGPPKGGRGTPCGRLTLLHLSYVSLLPCGART